MMGAVFHCASAPTSVSEEKCHALGPPTSSVAAVVKSRRKSSDRAARLVLVVSVLSSSQTELLDAVGLGRQ